MGEHNWCSGCYEQLGIDNFALGKVADDDTVCMDYIKNGRSSIRVSWNGIIW